METATCGECAYAARTVKEGFVCLADASDIRPVGQNEAPCARFSAKPKPKHPKPKDVPHVNPTFSSEDEEWIEGMFDDYSKSEANRNGFRELEQEEWQTGEAARAYRDSIRDIESDQKQLGQLIGVPSSFARKTRAVSKEYEHTEKILEDRSKINEDDKNPEQLAAEPPLGKSEHESIFHLFLSRIFRG